MKTSWVILFLCIAVLSSGCAANLPRHLKHIQDLKEMKVDCANKEAEIRFLESQIPTLDERRIATTRINIINAYTSKLNEENAIANGDYDAAVKKLIWDIRAQCPD